MSSSNYVQTAKSSYESSKTTKQFWVYLLWIIGSAVVIFIVAALVMLVFGLISESIISGFSALISGGACSWVVQRHKDAVQDEKQKLEGFRKAENSYEKSIAANEARKALLGKK